MSLVARMPLAVAPAMGGCYGLLIWIISSNLSKKMYVWHNWLIKYFLYCRSQCLLYIHCCWVLGYRTGEHLKHQIRCHHQTSCLWTQLLITSSIMRPKFFLNSWISKFIPLLSDLIQGSSCCSFYRRLDFHSAFHHWCAFQVHWAHPEMSALQYGSRYVIKSNSVATLSLKMIHSVSD